MDRFPSRLVSLGSGCKNRVRLVTARWLCVLRDTGSSATHRSSRAALRHVKTPAVLAYA